MAPEPMVPAPVMLPAEVIAMVGVLKKLEKPVALAKLIPLIVLELVMVAAGKLMPLVGLELLALVAVARVRSRPETAVAPTAEEALVTVRDCNLEASAVKAVSVRLTMVPEVALEVTVRAARVPSPVMLLKLPAVRSPLTTELKVGSPEALPCSSVVVVPARLPSKPAAVLVTTPAVVSPESVTEVLAVRVVKVPVLAVVAPMAVALIPVAVVLKVEAPVPEVMVRALVP